MFTEMVEDGAGLCRRTRMSVKGTGGSNSAGVGYEDIRVWLEWQIYQEARDNADKAVWA